MMIVLLLIENLYLEVFVMVIIIVIHKMFVIKIIIIITTTKFNNFLLVIKISFKVHQMEKFKSKFIQKHLEIIALIEKVELMM